MFIKYGAGTDIQALVPSVKNLVVHSVEGLSYDNVSVTLVQAMESERPATTGVSGGHPARFWIVLSAGLGVLAALIAAMVGAIVFAPERFARVMPARWAKRLESPEPAEVT